MEIDPDDYLLPAEAARRMGVSAETVRRWCRQGRIPCAKRPGGSWLVHRSAVRLQVSGGNPGSSVIDSEK